ncbi:hypothetical protein Tco_0779991 [Tanacetum coccineum]
MSRLETSRGVDEYETDNTEMKDAEDNKKEKTDEEKGDEEKFKEETADEEHTRVEHVQEDQTEEDLVKDNQAGALISKTQPEKPKLPPSSSGLSLSFNYGNQFLNVSFDISLVSIIKEPVDFEVQSMDLVQANIINEVKNQLPKSLPKVVSNFATPKKKSTIQEVLQKTPVFLAQPSSTLVLPSSRSAESLSEYVLKKILLEKMDKSRSFMTLEKHSDLYNGLLNSIMLDEAIASRDVNLNKVLRKRHHEDQDPLAVSDQGKKKRRKRKDSELSKKNDQSGLSLKGKFQSKSSSTGKSVQGKEIVHEAAMESDQPIDVDDMGNVNDQPNPDAAPKKDNFIWFNQDPRIKTPDPDWQKETSANDPPLISLDHELVKADKNQESFDDLMSSTIDFFNFVMHQLKKDKITKADLGLVFKLLKGTYRSSIELEYNMEQVLWKLEGGLNSLQVCFQF